MDYTVIDSILFSESLASIQQRLKAAWKPCFDPLDRIIIAQDVADVYPYVDSAGSKLIEIQKIINNVDISNCFILFMTTNPDVASEIEFVTKFYSVDPVPINFIITDGEYKKEVKRYSNTACKKLWDHLYVGPDTNVNPCCLGDHRFPLGNINEHDIDSIIHSAKSDQIRSWMKQGYRSIACGHCYAKEDSGIRSERQDCDPHSLAIRITSLDIRVNNICNFKCRMCSEYFSSAIQQETIELYGIDTKLGHETISLQRSSSAVKNNCFDKILPYVTNGIRKIYFAGGEPLMTSEHYKILDKLIEIKHTNLEIGYNTNLSRLRYKDLDAINYWNQFSNVRIGASIDADGRVAEYVRHGTVWSDIVQNIAIIKECAPHVALRITSTVSFLTIENLIMLQTKWITDNWFRPDDLELHVVTSPGYLSPAALPTHHKLRLTDMIHKHMRWLGSTDLTTRWHDVLAFMNNNDYTHTLEDFRSRTRTLDKHRDESFVDIFPEFADLYV